MKAVVLILVALVFCASAVSAGQMQVVRANGKVGKFRIDVSTEKRIRAVLGKPSSSFRYLGPGSVSRGHALLYACGLRCETTYAFNDSTRLLTDFETTSPSFQTPHGSHVGLTTATAEQLEGIPAITTCGLTTLIHSRSRASLIIYEGRVVSLRVAGPHSVLSGPAGC